jgi:lipopolysaccharide transport system permease protein
MINLFLRHRYLFWLMLERDLKERYAGSWMGLSWGILQPAAQFGIFVLVFSVILKVQPGAAYAGLPFSAWLLAGLTPWLFIAEVLGRSPNQIVAHASTVKNHAFPNELLPLVCVVSALINHGITMVILLGVLSLFGLSGAWAIAWLPLWILALAFFAMGISLFSSAVGVYFRDLVFLVQMLSMLWNFATPIAYPEGMVPASLSWLLACNPAVLPVRAYRAMLLGREAMSWQDLALFFAWSVVVFMAGAWTFRKLKKGFPDLL